MMKLRQAARVLSIAGVLSLAAGASAREQTAPTAPVAEAVALFAISYRAGPGWKPGVPMEQQGLRDHYFYWKALHDAGRVAVAGPVGPDGGLVLLRAADQAEADRVIAEDPASTAGVFVGEAKPFVPRFVGTKPLIAVKP